MLYMGIEVVDGARPAPIRALVHDLHYQPGRDAQAIAPSAMRSQRTGDNGQRCAASQARPGCGGVGAAAPWMNLPREGQGCPCEKVNVVGQDGACVGSRAAW